MAEHPRIEELRRRVQRDQASIAFAQLAEEYRRAGRFEEAIETCRTGLAHHPGYLSAHVTLGRALIEVGQLDDAYQELTGVLAAAPDNLAALKGLADISYRRGDQREALALYRRALEFAPNDPDLGHLVSQIAREIEPVGATSHVPDGLSFEEAMGEFLALAPGSAPAAAAPDVGGPEASPEPPDAAAPFVTLPAPEPITSLPSDFEASEPAEPSLPAPLEDAEPTEPVVTRPERAAMQVDALERWLDAILADRQKQA